MTEAAVRHRAQPESAATVDGARGAAERECPPSAEVIARSCPSLTAVSNYSGLSPNVPFNRVPFAAISASGMMRRPARRAGLPGRALAVMRGSAVAGLLVVLACGKASPREPSADIAEDASGAAVPPSAQLPANGPQSASAPAAPADAPRNAPPAPGASASASCAALTRGACMESPSCTLVLEPEPPRRDLYLCRAAEPPCETIVAQSAFSGEGREGARRQCESVSGCAVDEGGCYCPCRGSGQTSVPDGPEAPGCNCACGGGAPPRCMLAPTK
jgi:hypothetical protein